VVSNERACADNPQAGATVPPDLLPGTNPAEFRFGCLSNHEEADMPAKSKAQQKAAGAALAAKRGDIKKSELKGASKSMEKSMSEKELDKMASTKRKGKPEHVASH
jgi:hypothetical protein